MGHTRRPATVARSPRSEYATKFLRLDGSIVVGHLRKQPGDEARGGQGGVSTRPDRSALPVREDRKRNTNAAIHGGSSSGPRQHQRRQAQWIVVGNFRRSSSVGR